MSTLRSGLLELTCIKAASIMIAASAGASGAASTSRINNGTTGNLDTELPDPMKDFLGLLMPGDEDADDRKAR
jgi:hypothetical protein